ncbi:ATP-dependent nuclease [Bradyrhizobium pachyrhizi]|uniref:ATP-dependent nuclease n=1 Tax=Bradyrhizobium pachyrhizi TaxID=280333 RepID=UPI00067AEBDE|nr:AAA family ATPase [Bradyrhizobium pachyrhizi]
MNPPDLEKLLSEAKKFDPERPTDGFIREATFTNFKNIEPGTKLVFRFPLTAIVGANGTGKSSILHALWGMPRGYSTSRFWFSTAVDPIAAGKDPPSYWYEHWISKLKTFVQTRKVLGTKRHGYWEPARALARDGMTVLGPMEAREKEYRTAERWNPVTRTPLYINFKAEFSAFDRFFYFEDGQKLEKKQDDYVRRADRLNTVVRLRRASYKLGSRESVYENRDLTPDELAWIGFVLGREYDSAQYVRHRLLGVGESPTVVFKRRGIQYSEASAGSGELAIVRAVIQLLACEKNSLVLLDEPETSLHPGAQRNFLTFILHLWRQKQLQIVMSTHSPTIVELLPTQAVQLLEETDGAKCRIVPVTHPQVAFNRLGRAVGNFLNIAVEDDLLRAMVDLALKHLDEGERETIRLHTPPAGASSILAHDIPVWISTKQHFYVILDGDQTVEYPDFNEMTQAETDALPAWIKEKFGTSPDHHGSDPAQALLYLKWASARVRFLNAVCPELVLLRALLGSPDLELTNEKAKSKLIEEMESRGHKTDAVSLSANVSFIIANKGADNEHVKHLAKILREFLHHHSKEISG